MTDLRVIGGGFAAPTSAGTSPVLRCDAWLREYERARWQAQPRYQAAQPPSTGSEVPESAAAGEHVLASASEVVRVQHVCRESRAEAPQRESAVHGAAQAKPLQQGSASSMVEPSLPMAVPAPVTISTRSGRPEPQAVRRHNAPQRGIEWQSRCVHVHVGEHSTSVWIRDAHLLPHEAVRLLDQLRPLRAALNEIVRLTVNGHAVNTKEQSNGS